MVTALLMSASFMTITGGDDYYAKYSQPMLDTAAGEDKKALVIEGADHIYHVFEPETSSAGKVIEATAERFAETL